ncbi:unnamed protein product [Symbiodinium natans]|uniref:Uncharacterized protein n=1 Tax=Symbiodinium natans TaxID=878477 RepID=A0A812UAY8_9DINO|nr:unnamed protein product [Symbiodinium natans]
MYGADALDSVGHANTRPRSACEQKNAHIQLDANTMLKGGKSSLWRADTLQTCNPEPHPSGSSAPVTGCAPFPLPQCIKSSSAASPLEMTCCRVPMAFCT